MSLQYIILGLLKLDGPMSGYDLKQVIDGSTQNFWYCDLSQIYRALNANEQAAWVRSEADVDNPHKRKIYQITAEGESAFQDWLRLDFEFEPLRLPELARLFFGGFGNPEQVKKQLLAYRQTHLDLLASYQQIEKILSDLKESNPKHQPYWMISLQHGLFIAQAYVHWCDDALKRLEEGQANE